MHFLSRMLVVALAGKTEKEREFTELLEKEKEKWGALEKEKKKCCVIM